MTYEKENILAMLNEPNVIHDIAKRAGVTIDGMGYGEGNLEYFAECIVKHCAGIYESMDSDNAQEGTVDYIQTLMLRFNLQTRKEI